MMYMSKSNNFNICFIVFFFFFFMSLIFFFFFIMFLMKNLVMFIEYEIISFNSLNVVFSLLLDWMSLLFMSFVFLISSCVILYSKGYMESEMNLNRFIILVILFVISMILLILSPNLISILLGWDGLGLISYCLVIFYQNLKSFNSGMLTALSNRIGDVMILMSIGWMLNYGSWNYIFYMDFMKSDYSMFYISFMILVSAMTKSAQIPFSSWLPAAMAAPTPVSSLVHSSTLVTAGVYLLVRFNSLLLDTYFFKCLLLISSLTMFMSGISANYEFDLKKIIALSTLSQLGLMMSVLSLGMSDLAFFHLLTHAMFKALLFMCSGVFIHLMNNNQDIRYMGGISIFVPVISMMMIFSNMSLCGIPFLSGFYSKDLILDMFLMSNLNFLIFFMFYLSIGMTVFYSMRLLSYLMFSDYSMLLIMNYCKVSNFMLIGMFVLLMMSLISGSMMMWLLFYYPYLIYISLFMKLLVMFFMMMGIFLGYIISSMNLFSLNKFLNSYSLSMFLSTMWFMPNLSTYFLTNNFFNYSVNLSKNLDMGWLEYYSSYGLKLILMKYTFIYYFYQNNSLKFYLFIFILWMMLIFIMFLS